MNSNTQLTYKLWLDDLSTTPLDDFITIARQFFELLKKENARKIGKQYRIDKKDLDTFIEKRKV